MRILIGIMHFTYSIDFRGMAADIKRQSSHRNHEEGRLPG